MLQNQRPRFYKKDNVDYDSKSSMEEGDQIYGYPSSESEIANVREVQGLDEQGKASMLRPRNKLRDYGYLNNEEVISRMENAKTEQRWVKPWSPPRKEFAIQNHVLRGEMEKHGEAFYQNPSMTSEDNRPDLMLPHDKQETYATKEGGEEEEEEENAGIAVTRNAMGTGNLKKYFII